MNSNSFSSCALFAEDLRTEEQGIVTLVGIMPDNINYRIEGTSDAKPTIPKLVVYVRSTFDVSKEVDGNLDVKFISPSNQIIGNNTIESDFIKSQFLETRKMGAPQLTIISQFRISPFPLLEHGRFKVIANYGNFEVLAGFLNVQPSQ